jgi:pimeloyl-ACP methyl ester carboxylesterase
MSGRAWWVELRTANDLRGWGRLAFDATVGLTDVVEGMHRNIARAPLTFGAPVHGPTRGLTGFVYGCIRAATRLAGAVFDAALTQPTPMVGERISSPERDAVLATLNGIVGDHLAATANPLAIRMQIRRDGYPLVLERRELARTPGVGGRLLVLVHGSCMNDRRWSRLGHDHGAALARDGAYTPIYLHYNSGLHVSVNGRSFADTLEVLTGEWPVPLEELVVIGHSMGGLLIRSACHYGAAASHRWLRRLTKAVFLGTPHQGASLERGGNWVDAILGVSPYTAPLSPLGQIRSAGITDLRHGSLLDEDWQGRDRFELAHDRPRAVPLPSGIECYAMAATTARGDRFGGSFVGDGLVSVDSALGRSVDSSRALAFPQSRQWVGRTMSHLDLLSHPAVYERMKQWLVA